MDYNLAYIGNEIRTIRKEKKLTQEDLAFAADLSVDTIRRLESGKVDIKLSSLLLVLEELGIEFDGIFNNLQGSIWSSISYYTTEIDYYISELDYEKAKITLEEFEKVDKDSLPRFYQKKCIQYFKFYQSIIYNPKRSSKAFINGLNEAISISHKDFDIKNYKEYNYTNFEYRILSAMAFYFREIDETDFSYHILHFILKNISENNSIYPNISYNTARFYAYDRDFVNAKDLNEKSLHSSIRNNNILGLIYAYYQKGDILIKQRDSDAMVYIGISLDLCRASKRYSLENALKNLIYKNF